MYSVELLFWKRRSEITPPAWAQRLWLESRGPQHNTSPGGGRLGALGEAVPRCEICHEPYAIWCAAGLRSACRFIALHRACDPFRQAEVASAMKLAASQRDPFR
jgi:hypothetical protein